MSQSRALSTRQLITAALTVLLGFLASGVLGIIRTLIVSAQFGTSAALDAFYASQRLPEVLFVLVAGGALGSSFIPVYARLRQQDEAQAWRLASAVMTLAALAAGIGGGLIALFAPQLMDGLMAERSPELRALAADLTRIQMLTPFIFTISGLLMGLLQSHGRFLLPSLAISMNNVGIILGALFIAPNLPAGAQVAQVNANNIYGLAYGAVLSALLHLAVQLPALRGIGARLRVYPAPRTQGVGRVLWLMIPRVAGLAVTQINFLVNIILSSAMIEGSLVALNTAFTLMFFALGVIGQSVGSAVFPSLAALWNEGNREGYRQRLAGAVRAVLFLALPATAVFIVLGVPLVSLFERGEWTSISTRATAWALAFYGVGIAGFALLEVLSRAFYALEDSWTPVLIGAGAMLSNIGLSLLFVRLIGNPQALDQGAFGGLALANSLTTLIEALVLWGMLSRRVGGLYDGQVLSMALRCSLSALLAGAAMWLCDQVLPFEGFGLLLAGGMLGAGVYLLATLALRVDEVRALPKLLMRRG